MFRISYRYTPGYMRTLSRQGSDPSIGALHIPSLMNFPLVPTWKYVLLGHVIASPRLPGAARRASGAVEPRDAQLRNRQHPGYKVNTYT